MTTPSARTGFDLGGLKGEVRHAGTRIERTAPDISLKTGASVIDVSVPDSSYAQFQVPTEEAAAHTFARGSSSCQGQLCLILATK